MTDLDNQIGHYLNYCQRQKMLNGKTLKAYKIDLSQFSQFSIGVETPISKANITQYLQDLHQKYKPKTVKRKVASIRAFLNYLEFEEIIEINPTHKMRMDFREPISLPKSLPLKTIQKLLKTAHNLLATAKTEFQKNTRLRNVAVLEMLFATGLRVSELCSLRISDINFQSGAVNIWGKGAKERIVYIGNSETLAILKQYKGTRTHKFDVDGWFFLNRLGNRLAEQSVRDIISACVQVAKISEHITPHMMRHSFATLMLEEDVDIRYIQGILGHSSITTTQIYTHVSQNKQKRIMQKKHPRNKMSLS